MSSQADPSSTPEPQAGNGNRPLHERVFGSGVLILACGLVSAALIYLLAPDGESNTREIEFANPRAYEFQIERLGGKAAVYAVRFNEWFLSLWHGRQLAFTVAALSIAIALVCFWVAHRMSDTAQSARDKGRAE